MHAPQLAFKVGEHTQREQVGAHTKQEFALQVAQGQGCLDALLPEERFGFPGSLPRPVSCVILVVSW